ncbi:MAG: hypothetical protein LBI03_03140 [Clostridiales bacterium]|jgi:hypothetical protein|nr:hypothetical protein [Clostridiales bacterium]
MGTIMEYLLKEKKMTEVVASRTETKVAKYEDIRKEAEFWIKNKTYNTESPLVVNGYTAQDIYKLAPFMDGLGVFNFLVTLREDPVKAQEYIDGGFKRK